MFYRHWKKFALALTAFFWASCSSDNPTIVQPAYGVVCPPEGCGNPELSNSSQAPHSSSTSNEPIACNLQSIIYDTIECGHNTTTGNNFYCKDGFECYQNPECDRTIYCHDKQGNSISYTEAEFDTKYYIQNKECEKTESGEICHIKNFIPLNYP